MTESEAFEKRKEAIELIAIVPANKLDFANGMLTALSADGIWESEEIKEA